MSYTFYLRTLLASTVSVIALANSAAAQQVAANASENIEQVVVTGTHIANGNLQPTPVTVETAEQLLATTPESIPEGLNKLPQFEEASTSDNTTTGANGRGYNAPGDFLNLRDLGPIRTLILEDGHRVPGTFYDTTVNVDMLPQMLVQRVDVVTGGCSAVYGSDCVAGAVNFVLDRKFEGLKGLFQAGISDYGDRKSYRMGLAGGEDIGSHGHLIWSAEIFSQDAITDASSRPYGSISSAIVQSLPTSAGSAGSATNPYTLVFGVRQNNTSPNGLIVSPAGAGGALGPATSGALKGIAQYQFSTNGQSIVPFNAGTLTNTTNISIGGDGGYGHNEYLLPSNSTYQGFGHFDWDFGNDLTGYVEARYAHGHTVDAGQGITDQATTYPITIYSGNAFLTAAEQAELFPTGAPSSFTMARTENEIMSRLQLHQNTGELAFTSGLQGKTFGDFSWDTYFTYGDSRTQILTQGNLNTDQFYAAADAVKDPSTGNTVCASSLYAPGAFPGCVPLNLFGQPGPANSLGNITPAAYNYVTGVTWNNAHNTMTDVGADLNGTAFQGWAGPIKVAVGFEYRAQSLNVTTSTPNNTFNPQYLRLGSYSSWTGPGCPTGLTGAGPFYPTYGLGAQCAPSTSSYPSSNLAYFKEVQSGATGSEHIGEGYVETDAPLLKDLPLVELLSVNASYRYAQYTAAGNGVSHSAFSANTWKLGLEWQVIDDLKLRASRSRDFRAPTLWDLYQQQVETSSGVTDPLTGIGSSLNTITGGNPALQPEKWNNTTAGAVYTPSWFPGFSGSIDYFHIYSNNAIGSVNGNTPQFISNCAASGGTQSYCQLLVRPINYTNTSPANYPTLNYSVNDNIALNYSEGADIELNYETDLSQWSDLKGITNFRLLWTHYQAFKTQATPVVTETNGAGSAAGAPTAGLPSEKITFTFDYLLNNFTFDLLERYDSPVAQTRVPGQFYALGNEGAYLQTDVNFAYNFVAADIPATGYLNISNLFQAKGSLLQSVGYTSSVGMNYPVSPWTDVVGRYFTVGIRFKM
jgi:outer membrane receptor protein involved in Fe transport